ncbi:MAG: ATP-binding protein [Gemmatimonadota bacterium]
MRRRRLVPLAILVVFAGILISYVLYTQELADELRTDAQEFSWVYFQILQAAASDGLSAEGEFEILRRLAARGIPVVTTDETGAPTSVRNLPFEADLTDADDYQRVREYVAVLDERNPPLVSPAAAMEVHYGEPAFLRRLKWIPWLQALLLLTVVGAGAWIVRTSFTSESERLWSAMARESAHQMGTPLSSLVGWIELMGVDRATRDDATVHAEMKDDVSRLEKVSRRFELIGRPPPVAPISVHEILRRLARYFDARLPTLGSRVSIQLDLRNPEPLVLGNETLIEWAFENLVKNALDSLAGREGTIRLAYVGQAAGYARYHVSDDGPGVPLAVRGSLFDVGVTTKPQGWGVGLSLVRRILTDMHDGNIKLRSTTSGASFEVDLPLAPTPAGGPV